MPASWDRRTSWLLPEDRLKHSEDVLLIEMGYCNFSSPFATVHPFESLLGLRFVCTNRIYSYLNTQIWVTSATL